MKTVPSRRLAARLLVLAFFLSVAFVPFRHRTLVRGPDGSFAFLDERVWAPLWNQPTFANGVAEYPFRVLLGEWVLLGVAAALVVAWTHRRAKGAGAP